MVMWNKKPNRYLMYVFFSSMVIILFYFTFIEDLVIQEKEPPQQENDEEIGDGPCDDTPDGLNAVITVDRTWCYCGDTVRFSSNASAGSITDCMWNFGDGNMSSGRNVEHQYEETGRYNVSLSLTSSQGMTAKTYKTIYVQRGNKTTTKEAGVLYDFERDSAHGYGYGIKIGPNLGNPSGWANLTFENIVGTIEIFVCLEINRTRDSSGEERPIHEETLFLHGRNEKYSFYVSTDMISPLVVELPSYICIGMKLQDGFIENTIFSLDFSFPLNDTYVEH